MTSSPLAPDDPALAALLQLEALLRAAIGADPILLPTAEPGPLPTTAPFVPVPGTAAPLDDAAHIIAAARDALFRFGPRPFEPPPGPPVGADAFWMLTGGLPAGPTLTEPLPLVAQGEAGLVEGVMDTDGTIAFTDPSTGATARILLAPPVPDAFWG